MIKNEKDFLKRGIWWQKIYNLERPHQGLGNLTPYEKLKSLGYVTNEALCLFPPLILDSVCCLDPFTIKKKSVQDHLDHDLALSVIVQNLVVVDNILRFCSWFRCLLNHIPERC